MIPQSMSLSLNYTPINIKLFAKDSKKPSTTSSTTTNADDLREFKK